MANDSFIDNADRAPYKPLPVKGYSPQPTLAVGIVNRNKELEEELLRRLDDMKNDPAFDQRWLAIGRTSLEQAFMAINRAVFRPTRVQLEGDE